jgi:hypothetical protein
MPGMTEDGLKSRCGLYAINHYNCVETHSDCRIDLIVSKNLVHPAWKIEYALMRNEEREVWHGLEISIKS